MINKPECSVHVFGLMEPSRLLISLVEFDVSGVVEVV